jgi:hypothetical protein
LPTPAAHVGSDIGRHVAHAGVEDEMVARALKASLLLLLQAEMKPSTAGRRKE